MEPERLVKVWWFEPMPLEIERLKGHSAPTELNPEILKDYEVASKNMWNRIVGSD